MIIETTGNLLRDDAQALVNTVNTMGVMGKGLALQFKRAFPANFDAYVQACADGIIQPGKIFATPFGDGRWILNFPTKRHWRNPSRIEDIRSGLDDLALLIAELKLSTVALPPLGCGNGGLAWDLVRPLIITRLDSLDVEIRLYGPGTPPPADMPVRSTRPALTRNRARLLAALRRYAASALAAGVAVDSNTSLLEAHKITYLLQATGLDLGYRFEAGHFGPYSQDLDREISAMEGHYLIGYGDGTGGARADLRLLPAADQAEQIVATDDHFSSAWPLVERTAFGYEYPDGLELLSTVQFLATQQPGRPDANEIARLVAAWSPRKRRLFPAEDVLKAWAHLHKTTLLGQHR